MKYLGNCADKIENSIIESIKKIPGDVRPADNDMFSSTESLVMQKLTEVNYNLKGARWEMYYQDHLKFDASSIFKNVVKWWFVKLNPGDMFPYHIDTYENTKQLKRFWIACEDYKPGHVFFTGNQMLTKYSAGDIFEFNASAEWHGACNLSLEPKITLQVIATGLQNEIN